MERGGRGALARVRALPSERAQRAATLTRARPRLVTDARPGAAEAVKGAVARGVAAPGGRGGGDGRGEREPRRMVRRHERHGGDEATAERREGHHSFPLNLVELLCTTTILCSL